MRSIGRAAAVSALLLLMYSPAYAAIAHDATTNGTGTTTPVTVSHTATGSNRLGVIKTQCEDNSLTNCNVSSVTVNAVAATLAIEECVDNGTNENCASIWYFTAPPTTAVDYVVNFVGNPNRAFASVSTYTGASQIADPSDGENSADVTAGGTTFSTTVTTGTANSMIVDSVNHEDVGATLVEDASQTERSDQNTSDFHGGSSEELTTAAGPYVMSWTTDTAIDRGVIAAWSFKSAGGRRKVAILG